MTVYKQGQSTYVSPWFLCACSCKINKISDVLRSHSQKLLSAGWNVQCYTRSRSRTLLSAGSKLQCYTKTVYFYNTSFQPYINIFLTSRKWGKHNIGKGEKNWQNIRSVPTTKGKVIMLENVFATYTSGQGTKSCELMNM